LRLLLDTHVLIWWLEVREIDGNASVAIGDPANAVFVSAASAWEIAIKKTLAKLRAPNDLEEQLERHSFIPLPISVRHGIDAGALPLYHRDPFDRVLVAQAKGENLTLVTRDAAFSAYDVSVLPA